MTRPRRLPTREESLAALRDATRRARKPLRLADLPSALVDALLYHYGTLDGARRACGLPAPERARRWSSDRVVAELKRLDREGVVIRTPDLVALGRSDLLAAMTKYAGGIDRARRLAGIPAPKRRSGLAPRWDAETVIEEILHRHRSGETLAHGKAPRPLTRAGCHFFGNWAAAVEAAGLDYDRIRLVRPAYASDELIEILRGLAKKHPNAILADFSRKPLQRYRIPLTEHFGGVARAANAAGLKGWPARRKHALMPTRQVLAAIRARHRAGQTLREHPVAAEAPHLIASARRRFRTWRGALQRAGLADRVPLPRRWTPDTVVAALRARRRSGLPMLPVAVKRADGGLYQAAISLHGGYWKAARRAGAIEPAPVWTRERVVRELRALGRGNEPVTTTRAGMHLASACQRLFGSFAAACRAAKVARRRRERWSRERVLDDLRKLHRRHGRITEGVTGPRLAQACRVYFGSMQGARRAARVPR